MTPDINERDEQRRGEDDHQPAAFLRFQNLYFVPVIRHRLAFATLVRRALHQITMERRWNSEEDLVGVTLPPSVRDPILKAIEDLPRVSLILATVSGQGSREVVPVAPCDPMIEAIRTAKERDWQMEFLDLEVYPGNLLRGPCVQDPDWPDESLVRLLGAERYLTMIEGYFAQPPARLEPLDTWREFVITERLRRLQPLWRRVIVVCDAGLVRSVMSRLTQHPVSVPPEVVPDKARFKYDVVRNLKLDVLLYYLGDYPRLVERYNAVRDLESSWQRRDPGYRRADDCNFACTAEFNEGAELRSLVLECADRTRDLTFSTRQHQAFALFLGNLLRSERRICPRPDVLYAAARGCLGVGFAERLHCFLAGYESYVKAELVERRATSEHSPLLYQIEIDATSKGYWPRTCNPNPSPYYSIRPPRQDPKAKSGGAWYRWLPEEQFLRTVYRKVRQKAVTQQRQEKSAEYRGSIEMGIDVRRTLKASRGGVPRLVVKCYSRQPVVVPTANEPHLWVLSGNFDTPGFFNSGGIGEATTSKITSWLGRDAFIGSIDIYENPAFGPLLKPIDPRGNTRVRFSRRCGWLTFAYDFPDTAAARKAYGAEFTRRVPNHSEFDHPCGCVHRDFTSQARSGARWVDIALLTALKYAKTTVVIVSHPHFVISSSIRQHPLAAGKNFLFISLNEFSRSQRQQLSTNYMYLTEGGEDEDAEAMFRIAMRRYWD